REPRVGTVLGDLGRQLNGYNWPMLSFFAFNLPIILGREIQHVRSMGYGGSMRLAQLTGMIDKAQRAIDLLLMFVEQQVYVLAFPAPTQNIIDPARCCRGANQRQIKKMLDARIGWPLAKAMVRDTDSIVNDRDNDGTAFQNFVGV